jgi:hypothetical protein
MVFRLDFPCQPHPSASLRAAGPTCQPLPPSSSRLRSRPLDGRAAASLRRSRGWASVASDGINPAAARSPPLLPLSNLSFPFPGQTLARSLHLPSAPQAAAIRRRRSASARFRARAPPPPPPHLVPTLSRLSPRPQPLPDPHLHPPPPFLVAPLFAASLRSPMLRASTPAVLCCPCARTSTPFAPRAVPPPSAATTTCRARVRVRAASQARTGRAPWRVKARAGLDSARPGLAAWARLSVPGSAKSGWIQLFPRVSFY